MAWKSSARFSPGAVRVKETDPSHSPALMLAIRGKRPGTAASAISSRKSLRGMMDEGLPCEKRKGSKYSEIAKREKEDRRELKR
jgi:hypothetical protein